MKAVRVALTPHPSSPAAAARRAEPIALRNATAAEAAVIHALIDEHLAEGHLLARELPEVSRHADRFVVAVQGDRVIACAELAPLSHDVAEVRSFVVSREARSLGVGRRLIDTLFERATERGFLKLCAFTHSPGYFLHLGFSIVPHQWLPEKIETDCRGCRQFGTCGQHAVMRPVGRSAVRGRHS